MGDTPTFGYEVFSNVTATACYPVNNLTWAPEVRQNYGGTITWEPYGETEPIMIISQPIEYVGAVNDDVVFTVGVTGNGLVYQWYYSSDHGSTWTKCTSPGYNTDTLQVALRAYRNGYQYKCVITDAFGESVASNVVSMTVKASEITIVHQPESVENAVLSQLYQFTVVAEGDNLTYRWELSTDGGESWTISYLGGYNTDTLFFSVTAARASKLYKCVITDAAGNSVETNTVSVTIG